MEALSPNECNPVRRKKLFELTASAWTSPDKGISGGMRPEKVQTSYRSDAVWGVVCTKWAFLWRKIVGSETLTSWIQVILSISLLIARYWRDKTRYSGESGATLDRRVGLHKTDSRLLVCSNKAKCSKEISSFYKYIKVNIKLKNYIKATKKLFSWIQ